LQSFVVEGSSTISIVAIERRMVKDVNAPTHVGARTTRHTKDGFLPTNSCRKLSTKTKM
jgi:hypothetical protein